MVTDRSILFTKTDCSRKVNIDEQNKNHKIIMTTEEQTKSLPSAIILAEKFAESKREHVLKCRIEKGSIANLGLYLGFIEGYNYVIEELKRGNAR
jgi:hypothetical protein